MNNNNNHFENRLLNTKQLIVSPVYQRVMDNTRVKKIIANFNPNLVNAIKVSHRDNQYFVFDGQHTAAALKIKNGGKDLMVNCNVFENLSEAEEAILFAEQTGISRKVDINAKLKALYVSKDTEIVEMYELTKKTGLYFDFSKSKATNGITALAKLNKIFKSVAGSEYIEILSIIKETWNGMPESLSTEILGGMYLFCTVYKGKYDHELLVKQLSKVSPIVIKREGKVYIGGGDLRFTKQIFNIYNKNYGRKRS